MASGCARTWWRWTTPVNPRDYLGRFYVDSLVHDPDALRLLLRLMGPERIALGSDYPFPLGEPRPGELIESLHRTVARPAAHRLLAGNALEFLGLRPDHPDAVERWAGRIAGA